MMGNRVKLFQKAISMVFLLLLSVVSSVWAESDDLMLSFSSRGPDVYADGTPVLVGEMYALVWMRNGCEFAGIDMNGAAVDSRDNAVVAAVPRARYSRRCGGVRCPQTCFQLQAAAKEAYAEGTFALVLLDTRVSDGKGGFVPSGSLSAVQGWGFVENSRVKASSGSCVRVTNAGNANGTVTTTTSVVPAGETIPQPRITGIRVEDGFVRLTVKDTSPRVLYNVAAGEAPGRRRNSHAATAPAQGHNRADQEIELRVPIQEGQRFFQVIRN